MRIRTSVLPDKQFDQCYIHSDLRRSYFRFCAPNIKSPLRRHNCQPSPLSLQVMNVFVPSPTHVCCQVDVPRAPICGQSVLESCFRNACRYALSCSCAVVKLSTPLSSSENNSSILATMRCCSASGGSQISVLPNVLRSTPFLCCSPGVVFKVLRKTWRFELVH